MEIIDKCIFEAFENGEFSILIHQANCYNTMGAGIAKEIKRRYPKAFEVDAQHYLAIERPEDSLGQYSTALVNTKKNIGGSSLIINLYSQLGFGREKRQTNYEALASGLEKICRIAHESHQFGFPFGLGCGLGGGNWNIVKTIIEETLKENNRIGSFYRLTK